MILRSFHKYGELSNFDERTGHFSPVVFHGGPPSEAPVGLCSTVEGTPIAFYRRPDGLYLRFGGDVFEIKAGMRAEVIREPNTHTLEIFKNGKRLPRFSYRPPELFVPIEQDPTPMVEEDHFDFPLFICNLVNSPSRIALCFTGRR